jgi:hypothetical protein
MQGTHMSILFRCPECDHKLRAADAAAGRQSKCKCGAVVTIPDGDGDSPDEDDTTGSAWQLKPRFNAASGDLCEAITAWSPLCAKKPARPRTEDRQPADYLQGILVGAAGVLIVSFAIIGVAYLFRGSPAEQQTTQDFHEQAQTNPPPPEKTPQIPKETKTGGDSLAPKQIVKSPAEKTPQLPKEPNKTAGDSPAPKEIVKVQVKEKTEPVGPTKPKEPTQPKEDLPKPAPKPVAADKIEIVGWYTTVKVTIIGNSGKEEPLEPQEEALKAEWVFVAVKARVPAKMLEGKKFDVEKADAELSIPSSKNPFAAFGSSINEKLWFAPEKGQCSYAAAKDEVVTQSWLFIAPLKDLQSGRTTFQLKGQPAVALTLESRQEESP